MKFLIDNNLSPRLVISLYDLGFDASHVRDYRMERAPDEEIFQLAFKEGRVLVSADTDFGFILVKWGKEKPSLILFRHFSPHPDEQLKALQLVLERYQQELETGSIIVIEPERIRIRKLPLY